MNFRLVINPVDDEWQRFIESSPQGSIFSDLRYLLALGASVTRYFVKTADGDLLGGAVVIEDGVAMHSAPFPFVPYQGIMFAKSVAQQTNYKRVTNEFRVVEFLISSLLERYENFSMALHPRFTDLRPFLWHNYHEPTNLRFTVNVRYTALLDLGGFSQEYYLDSIRENHRRNIEKNNAVILETTDVSRFLSLYEMTFLRQGLFVSPSDLDLVERIVQRSLAGSFGRLSAATTDDGIASMTLFVFDEHTGYYLFGANNPDLRSTGASTALMFDNIRAMSELGLTRVDFVGMNSPNRSHFKLGFNPKLTTYHEVHLKR